MKNNLNHFRAQAGPSSDHIGTWDMQAGLHHFLWDRPNLIGLLHTISPLVKIDYFKVDGNFVPILKQ